MDSAQLKQYIIRKIEETDDIELLLKIEAVIDAYHNAQLSLNESPAIMAPALLMRRL